MFWNKYPYTNFHELNLDMILEMIKDLNQEWDEFKILNSITFDGEWDITKQYPAWCIVNTNGGADGYISIKPVPAGITINNTEYWSSIVDYTATIADLQNRVITLEGNVSTLNGSVSALQTNVAQLNLLQDHRYIFVGDSYGTQPDAGSGWPAITMTSMGLTAGTDAYRVSADSTGFIGGAGAPPGDYTWLTLLQSASGSISNHSTITDIVVMGGTNDYTYTSAQLETAIASFVSYCNSEYPNAVIHVGMCSNVTISAWYDEAFRILDVYQGAQRNHSKVKYINNIENALRGYDSMQADMIHPTAAGSVMLAACLSEYLKTGSGGDTNYGNPNARGDWVTLTVGTYGAITSYDQDIVGRKIGNTIEIATVNNHAVLANNITTNGTPVALMTFNNSPLFGSDIAESMTIGEFCDSANHNWPALFYIKENTLYASMIRVASGTPATFSSGDVYMSFKITANTLFN